jgi:AAA domain
LVYGLESLGDEIKAVSDFLSAGVRVERLEAVADASNPRAPKTSEVASATSPDEAIRAAGLQTVTWCELTAAAFFTSPLELVDGHVSEGDVVLVYGFVGIGKSVLTIDMAVSIHRGERFLGQFATNRARVGIIDEETGYPPRLGRRLAQLARARGIDPADVEMPVFAVSQRARLDTDDGFELIYAWIAANELSVLVIDTLRRVHRLRENEADDMNKIEGAIKELQRRTRENLGRPLTVILIHHAPKPRQDGSNAPETMARGSGDIIAGADAAFYLRKSRKSGQVVVEQSKARWGESQPPYLVRIEGDADELRVTYVGNVDEASGQQDKAYELFRTTLAAGGEHGRPDLLKRARAVGISVATSDRVLSTLVAKGEATKGKNGKVVTFTATDLLLL